ncbi:hypothetical protein [Hymenobacter sp. B81]|uniref:hypothetical protein n=1 Tax=Hymenobacter sp. B81 TaxID=3344878 RepID=UPI0037DC2667
MIDLRHLDQKIDLHHQEVAWLASTIEQYLLQLVAKASVRPLDLPQALSIKPLGRIAKRLWSAHRSWKSPLKPRKIRLEHDELQLLTHLAGQLQQQCRRDELLTALGKVHQKAILLEPFFQIPQ